MPEIPIHVVRYYAEKEGVALDRAVAHFEQLEVFLVRGATAAVRPSQTVDQAWHAFILHTQEYLAYCMERFGRIVHHVPDRLEEPVDTAGLASHECSSNCKSH